MATKTLPKGAPALAAEPSRNGRPSARDVVIDAGALQLEDLETLALVRTAGEDWLRPEIVGPVLDMLDRAVEGGVRERGFAMTDFMALLSALGDAMSAAQNPAGAEGNA